MCAVACVVCKEDGVGEWVVLGYFLGLIGVIGVEGCVMVDWFEVGMEVVLLVVCEASWVCASGWDWAPAGLRRGDLNGFERAECGEERPLSLRLLDASVLFDMLPGIFVSFRCMQPCSLLLFR